MRTTPEAAAVEARSLGKTFRVDGRSLEALTGLDFELAGGEFVSIIGPSGCGKSTLLRLIGGLLEPDQGTITVSGAPPPAGRRAKRFGLVPQTPALVPWRTVREQLTLLPRLNRGQGRGPIAPSEVDDLLEAIGLAPFADALPAQLSGGMQQRVSLARAFALRPPVLLMDEPFAALDEITRSQMRYLLLDVWRDTGATVVFVTHSIDEAVHLSDRVLVLTTRPGRLSAEITIKLDRPRRPGIEDIDEFHHHAAELRAGAERGERPVERGRAMTAPSRRPQGAEPLPVVVPIVGEPEREPTPDGSSIAALAFRYLAPVAGLAVLFGGWELYVRLADVSPITLPAPSRVIRHLAAEPTFYLRNGWVTLSEALLGFFIALIVALAVATVMAHWRFAERATMPVIVLIQSTPVAVLAPVFLLWFGFSPAPKVLVAALFAFVPFVANALIGLRSVDNDTLEVVRSVDASSWEILWRLRMRYAMPALFAAARICVSLALVGAVIGELYGGSTQGLGYQARIAQSRSLVDQLWGSVLSLALIGIVLTLLVMTLERRLLRWHISQTSI